MSATHTPPPSATPFVSAPAHASERSAQPRSDAKMFAAAAGYERFMGRWSRLIAPKYLEFIGAVGGERMLDVGTGTGALAYAAVTSHADNTVVGVDPSAAFIDYNRSRAGPYSPRFEAGDAQNLPFDAGTFDQTMALLVLNFVPNHLRAVNEMIRVTRAGGIVSAGVWDYGDGMQMLRVFWDEAVSLDPAADPLDERHMKLSREGQLSALWTQAGLAEVEERPLLIVQQFASFEDYWGAFLEGVGPAGTYVASLDTARRSALEARLRARLLRQHGEGQITLQARVWCVRGRAPGHAAARRQARQG